MGQVKPAPKQVGQLIVLREIESAGKRRRVLVRCGCGTEWPLLLQSLRGKRPTTQCRHCRDQANRVFSAIGAMSGTRWNQILINARTRGIEVAMEFQEAVDLFHAQRGLCALTGIPLTLPKQPPDNSGTASLDRIDSEQGYVAGNVQWVHKDINRMKQNLAQARFVELCSLVAEHTASQPQTKITADDVSLAEVRQFKDEWNANRLAPSVVHLTINGRMQCEESRKLYEAWLDGSVGWASLVSVGTSKITDVTCPACRTMKFDTTPPNAVFTRDDLERLAVTHYRMVPGITAVCGAALHLGTLSTQHVEDVTCEACDKILFRTPAHKLDHSAAEWARSETATLDILGLIADEFAVNPAHAGAMYLDILRACTDAQLVAIEDWAGALICDASDNDVVIPPCPDVLRPYLVGASPKESIMKKTKAVIAVEGELIMDEFGEPTKDRWTVQAIQAIARGFGEEAEAVVVDGKLTLQSKHPVMDSEELSDPTDAEE